MTKTLLILGGYGVFGSRLARRLTSRTEHRVVIAGRDLSQARALASELGCEAVEMDTGASGLKARMAPLKPDFIIDAAGPYQSYGDDPYCVARAAIDLGAHYLDLSDDGTFTAGIAALNDAAERAGVTVLSGVSSVPALSSVVAAHLADGLEDVHAIEAVILPGNRAPRGRSVMRSILSQVGRPLRLWEGRDWSVRAAWSDLQRVDLHVIGAASVSGRRASLIGAPDLTLFPDVFKARSVRFRAGLELSIMHYGLWLLHWLPRLRLRRSLTGLTGSLKWAADKLQSFGTDRGGMRVHVVGQARTGALLQRTWTLIVGQGDGPFIPGLPAEILVWKLLAGDAIPGAGPCLKAFSLTEFDHVAADLDLLTGETQRPMEPVFKTALGGEFDKLPPALQDLHTVLDHRRWRGEASVARGAGWMARIAGAIAGFPPAARTVPVEVEMQRTEKGETWTRRFGDRTFKSYLSARARQDKPVLFERFGWLRFEIDLNPEDEKLHFPVRRARFLVFPLPPFLRPASDTYEYVDAHGRGCFSVRVSLPIAGLVAQYEGWLDPV